MLELGEQMFHHLVRWANLGVEMPDGTLTKSASIVWCSAQTLPDLSGWRSDKSYANDYGSSDRDEYSKAVSPARRARGNAFRPALVQIFLDSTRADSTRVGTRVGAIANSGRSVGAVANSGRSVGACANSGGKSSRSVTRNKQGI